MRISSAPPRRWALIAALAPAAAVAAPVGVWLADPPLREAGAATDHRAVLLEPAEIEALAARRERARFSSWTPDCPGGHLVVLREAGGEHPLQLRTAEGEPIAMHGHPWRWSDDWRVSPACAADPQRLGPLLGPVLARWDAPTVWAYRVEAPVDVEPAALVARGLQLMVVDPGLPTVELEVSGAALAPGAPVQPLDDALDARLAELVRALEPLGVVSADGGGGSSRAGATVEATRHLTVRFARGAAVERVHAEVVRRGAVVARTWRPATWTAVALLPEPDPVAAARQLREVAPELAEVAPW